MKTNDLTTLQVKDTKSDWVYFDEFFDFNEFKQRPVSEQWLAELSKRLVFWAKDNDDALILNEFFLKEGIGKSTVANWKKQSKLFKNSYDFAKQIIGTRREIGALNKKFDTNVVMFTMPMYSKSWKELEEWRSSLKVKELEKAGKQTITVVMEKVQSTEFVPKKKQEKENEVATT